jgi:F-type H+-transporting ATPase subunit alpha
MRQIDRPPEDISARKRISRTFDTGISLVDIMITLGKGQRELVIGDRKTGKTNFLFQTLVTQARQGAICIYAAIGKKRLDIKEAEEYFRKQNILDRTIILAATSDDPASVIYIAPYAAMTLAEYFRDQGQDVVLVLDDLYTHAKFYREISLLGRRFPARNSYPADIFYTHARLLERAGNFIMSDGSERAITCLPVAETIQGDVSGYIQTNLMSMTDGHIYFDIDSFTQGRRPAVNPFLSVSRVGRQTQTKLKRSISREVLSFLTLHARMERFSHFGAEVTPTIRDTLSTGDRILHYFDQEPNTILDSELQLFLFTILWFGYWNSKNYEQMKSDISVIIKLYGDNEQFRQQVSTLVNGAQTLNDFMKLIAKNVIPFLNQLFPPPPAPVQPPAAPQNETKSKTKQ